MTNNIIENDFQRNQSSAYQLSILVGLDSLVYAIHDDETHKLLVLKHLGILPSGEASLTSDLNEAIGKDELLGLLYRRVKIAFIEASAALVPDRLFNEYEKETYLKDLVPATESADIKTDDLLSLKVKAVYQLDRGLAKMLKARFPTAHFYSLASPFLAGSLQMLPEGAANCVFACFQSSFFQLAIFNKADLLFYNEFQYRSANDVLYFMLLALEQYGLHPAEVPVYLTGKLTPDSDINKLLYRYIGNIGFLTPPAFVRFGKAATATDPNHFFPLHSLLLCK